MRKFFAFLLISFAANVIVICLNESSCEVYSSSNYPELLQLFSWLFHN